MLHSIPRGLMARIAGFHPAGPGSIPGVGGILFSFDTIFMYARILICPCMPIYMSTKPVNVTTIPRGLTARIAGFHPAGPGSTPGVGKYFPYFV